MKDAGYLALLLLLFDLSGERERDLRLRLEGEREFAESPADQHQIEMEELRGLDR